MYQDLQRFVNAQTTGWPEALAEIRAGDKRGHWMWFIFPQLRGLGQSDIAWYYGIQDRQEACRYLTHPILGSRLKEITGILLDLPESNPRNIFGDLDAMKFRSSMTLFAEIAGPGSVFEQALERFFGGHRDGLTMDMLK